MNRSNTSALQASTYRTEDCDIGIVHLGYGAFHRAHQAVYIDEYMEKTVDLRWGIAAVNLRAAEAAQFAEHKNSQDGFILKSVSPTGEVNLSRIRSHLGYFDWSVDPRQAEALISRSQ